MSTTVPDSLPTSLDSLRPVLAGPALVVPTGARGRGVVEFKNVDGTLTVLYDDGTSAPVMTMATGDDAGGGIETGDPDAIVLSQAVVDYVTKSLVPYEKTASHDADVTALKSTDATHKARLDAIDTAVAKVIAEGATDAELAKAIADLNMAAYLKSADAANLYAAKAHNHPITDITGLSTKLANMDAAIAAAAGVDMSSYATDAEVASALTAYLKTATADTKYATKVHTHAIADVTGLQAGLDAKMAKLADGTKAGQQLVWDGTKWGPGSVSGAVTYAYSQSGTLAVKSGTSAIYNDTPGVRTVTALRASVGTAPAGSGVTVSLKVSGTQIATVTIPAGQTTAVTTGTWTWGGGAPMTVDITAVGSDGTEGSDLTVSVLTG